MLCFNDEKFLWIRSMKLKEYENGLQVYSVNVADIQNLFASKRSPQYYIAALECVEDNATDPRAVEVKVQNKPSFDFVSALGKENPLFDANYLRSIYKRECWLFFSSFGLYSATKFGLCTACFGCFCAIEFV